MVNNLLILEYLCPFMRKWNGSSDVHQ